MAGHRRIRALLLLLSCAAAARAQTDDPRADVVVYGDHTPDRFRDGTDFNRLFTYREDADLVK